MNKSWLYAYGLGKEARQKIINDYQAGDFDGDGTICKTKIYPGQRSQQWVVQLVGSEHMIRGFSTWIQEQMNYTIRIYPRLSIWETKARGVALCQKMIRLLYMGATISLDRKADLASELLAQKVIRIRHEKKEQHEIH
jgi:hypothetical protein